MLHRMLRPLTYSNVTATLALFLSLGGVAWAAATIGSGHIVDNSIRSKDIRNDNLTGVDIKNGTVTGGDLRNDGVGSADIKAGAVRSSEVANNSLGQADLAAGSVGTSEHAKLPWVSLEIDDSLAINDNGGGFSAVFFDAEVSDTFGMHIADDRFVNISKPGIYHIEARTVWNNVSPLGEKAMRVSVGTDVVQDFAAASNELDVVTNSISREMPLDAGDTVQVSISQESDSDDSDTATSVTLTVRWVAPLP